MPKPKAIKTILISILICIISLFILGVVCSYAAIKSGTPNEFVSPAVALTIALSTFISSFYCIKKSGSQLNGAYVSAVLMIIILLVTLGFGKFSFLAPASILIGFAISFLATMKRQKSPKKRLKNIRKHKI